MNSIRFYKYKTMLFLTMFCFFLGFAGSACCQSARSKNSSTQLVHQQVSDKDVKPLPYAEKGTYQLIYKDEKNAPPFEPEILQKIEYYRNDTADVYLPLGEWTVVKVLSHKKINSSRHIPLEEWIYAKDHNLNFDELMKLATQ